MFLVTFLLIFIIINNANKPSSGGIIAKNTTYSLHILLFIKLFIKEEKMIEEIKFVCPNCSAEVNTSDMIKNQLEENKIMGMPLPLIISEGFNKLKVSKAIRYANEKYNEAVVYANSKQLPATTNIHRAIAILKIVMELQEMQCNNTATINEQLKKLETEKEKLLQQLKMRNP